MVWGKSATGFPMVNVNRLRSCSGSWWCHSLRWSQCISMVERVYPKSSVLYSGQTIFSGSQHIINEIWHFHIKMYLSLTVILDISRTCVSVNDFVKDKARCVLLKFLLWSLLAAAVFHLRLRHHSGLQIKRSHLLNLRAAAENWPQHQNKVVFIEK